MCKECGCEIKAAAPTMDDKTNMVLGVTHYLNEVVAGLFTNNHDKIKKDIVEKLGESSGAIFDEMMTDLSKNNEVNNDNNLVPSEDQLNEEITEAGFNDDCPECGKMSDALMAKYTNQIKIIDDFTNDDIEGIANQCIEVAEEHDFTLELLKEVILEHKPEYTIDTIPEEFLTAVQRKIIFIGVMEGWLLDQLFIEDYSKLFGSSECELSKASGTWILDDNLENVEGKKEINENT